MPMVVVGKTIFTFIRHISDKRQESKLNKLLLKMPRSKKYIEETQLQRLRVKERNSKYIPGTASLQVLGSGAPGAPASVYLFTDQSRYLFNCGEGTQRLAHEHKIKLARLEHIFMTRTSWENLGGLPGLSLTVQDAGVPKLTLHGPPGLEEIYRGMRKFVVLKHLKVGFNNCEGGGEFDDSVLNISYIPLRKQTFQDDEEEASLSTNIEIDETDYYAYENERSRPNSPQQHLDNSKRTENVVISYICKLKPKPGVLNLEKCVERGVPPGPLLGQLKNGFDIVLPDGNVVLANEVLGAPDTGPIFIIIGIPNRHYLKSLDEAGHVYEKFEANARSEGNPSVVVHFTPQGIIDTGIYQNFMKKFNPYTTHLFLNSTNKFSGYLAAHRIQWQLNQINEFVFPILRETCSYHLPLKPQNKKQKLLDNLAKASTENGNTCSQSNLNVNSLTCYHLRPAKGLDHSSEPILIPQEYIKETHAVEGFSNSLAELRTDLSKIYTSTHSVSRSNEFPKIVFLGTGSCIPNKTRNVSAILIHTTRDACMLLDCGEGTWGQIVRFYGEEEAKNVLHKLKAVYISHLHADHHIGLIGIIKAHQEMLGSQAYPLMLLAPKQIESWLYFYNQRIEPISKGFVLFPNYSLLSEPLNNSTTSEMGIRRISTCPVLHCPHSFGIAIELNTEGPIKGKPFKITYSGDTKPCDDLVELGKNSTILIHEATMEDELSNEANFKMHSTISQAIEQGLKMNAEYTILTHFSQRYAKLPRIVNFPERNVGIAFDNMEVTLNDLSHLHLLYPTLRLMFAEHCEEMEQKALKRALKGERKRLLSNTPEL